MSSKQLLNLMFIFRADKVGKKTRQSSLQCRLKISGTQTDIPVGLNVHIDDWDESKNTVKTDCERYPTYAKEISDFINVIDAHYKILSTERPTVTAQMIRAAYERAKNPEPPKPPTPVFGLLHTIDELICDFEKKVKLPEDHQEKRSMETLKQWYSTRTKLIEYLSYQKTGEKPYVTRKDQRDKAQQAKYIKDSKRYDIPLDDFCYSFAEDFMTYLTDERTIKLKAAAANKQLKNTKQVFTYAVQRDWIKVNPLAAYMTKDVASEVIPLEWNEIEALINLTHLNPRLERIRDAFLVQIFTGFSFQDLKALTLSNLRRNIHTGVHFLSRQRGKTKVNEMVPALPFVLNMITKYGQDRECLLTRQLFPVPSNTHFNEYLKELQTLAGISKSLHTHLARHTFAHLMLNYHGLALEVVSAMLGHNSIRTTQRYCKVTERLITTAVWPLLKKAFRQTAELFVIPDLPRSYEVFLMAA